MGYQAKNYLSILQKVNYHQIKQKNKYTHCKFPLRSSLVCLQPFQERRGKNTEGFKEEDGVFIFGIGGVKYEKLPQRELEEQI